MTATRGNSADRFEEKNTRLYVWLFVAIAIGNILVGLIDDASSLTTHWDRYFIPIASGTYLVSAALIFWRRGLLTFAISLAWLSSCVYQLGILYNAIHSPDPTNYYSAASGCTFFPLVYVALYITLPRGATLISVVHCTCFYVLYAINATLLASPTPSPERLEAEHLLLSVILSHPLYILALRYIVQLRERLFQTQREAFEGKANFLAMLSHEIRNLLQTMVSAIDLLEIRLKDAGERKPLTRLQNAATQLQTYLEDVGELTKLENPALNVQVQEVDIPELLQDICEEWVARATTRGLSLQVAGQAAGAHRLRIATDKARLRQIVANLVSNALKYTREGSVVLCASPLPEIAGGVTLEVADTGIGIDPQYLEKIFQPYVRLSNPEIGRSEGSGLGLTIVARLVAGINGDIRVVSEPGKGSRFSVHLRPMKPKRGD